MDVDKSTNDSFDSKKVQKQINQNFTGLPGLEEEVLHVRTHLGILYIKIRPYR